MMGFLWIGLRQDWRMSWLRKMACSIITFRKVSWLLGRGEN